jgi:hypothetical protein
LETRCLHCVAIAFGVANAVGMHIQMRSRLCQAIASMRHDDDQPIEFEQCARAKLIFFVICVLVIVLNLISNTFCAWTAWKYAQWLMQETEMKSMEKGIKANAEDQEDEDEKGALIVSN